jgi:hypothetical protein
VARPRREARVTIWLVVEDTRELSLRALGMALGVVIMGLMVVIKCSLLAHIMGQIGAVVATFPVMVIVAEAEVSEVEDGGREVAMGGEVASEMVALVEVQEAEVGVVSHGHIKVPRGMRLSSLWLIRLGQWLGLLHPRTLVV